MQNKDRNVPQRGAVTVTVKDRDGNVVDQRRVKNMIVSGGRALVANLFRGFEKRAVSHLALWCPWARPRGARAHALQTLGLWP
jgi:hypothetical protein